jgi:hypothetical protein
MRSSVCARLSAGRLRHIILAMELLPAFALVVAAQTCPDPASLCAGFREHDLPSRGRRAARHAPRKIGALLRGHPHSARRAPEKERARIKLFPSARSSSRFECDGDVENNVKYTNTREAAFVAVHGANHAQRRTRSPPGTREGLRTRTCAMQVVLVHP